MAKQPKAKGTPAENRTVRAKYAGLYDGHRREGEEFDIKSPQDLAVWMEPVGWDPNEGQPQTEAAG